MEGQPQRPRKDSLENHPKLRKRRSELLISDDNKYLIYVSQCIRHTASFTNLMGSSKGRQRFCEWAQYLANFYVVCMKESPVYGADVREHRNLSATKAKELEASLSSGRKIFRLFLWLNELSELNDLLNAENFSKEKVLKMMSILCSFFYYITDNIVFLSKLDFVSPFVPGTSQFKWKRIRNFFSFLKTVFESVIALYRLYLAKRQEQECDARLSQLPNSVVEWHS